MDKRILIIIALFNAGALSVFFYKRANGNHAPAIHFNIDKNVINAGDSITFTDNTQGAIRWKWDFGDTEPSFKQTGKHTYFDLGKHKIVLTVYGASFGPIVDSTKEIVVRSAPKPDTVKQQPAPVAVEPPKVEKKPTPPPPAPEAHKTAPVSKPKPHHAAGGNDGLPSDDGPVEIRK